MISHPLDTPIWSALTSLQLAFAEGSPPAVRFVPDVTTLGAVAAPTLDAFAALSRLLANDETVGLFLDEEPTLPRALARVDGGPLLQMVLTESAELDGDCPDDAHELGAVDAPEMLTLATRTRPGPFGTRTRELGTFLGIRRGGQLVAMAGERMRMAGFTEISAVCTDPSHTGLGYARALMLEIARRMRSDGAVPFLHVLATNERAIRLYRQLGFTERRRFQYTVVRRLVH